MSETVTKGKEASSVAPASGSASGRAAAVQIPADAATWWEQHDQRVYQCIKIWVEQWWASEVHSLHAAVGEIFGEHRASIRTTLTTLKERIVRLETASSYEERFARLAYEAKRDPEIAQGELLAKIEGLQRQVDLKVIADFRELADRVTELEKTNSLAERFSRLEHQLAARQGTLLSQDQLLEKIESLQRQVDEFNRVADLDARFRELAERVGELEKTNSLEAHLTKLANEAKREPDIQQGELLAKIEGLQRELDELKRVAAQPGPPGPPGKLPLAKAWESGKVYYEGDCTTHNGSTYQALRDTGNNVTHSDWVCLARAGRDGRDGATPEIRGTYFTNERYAKLDIVACDGAAFIAKHDSPGMCPGEGWQLMSKQGKRGQRGETGERGPRGEKGDPGPPAVVPQFLGARIDEEYNLLRILSDGSKEIMPLRPAFEKYHSEAAGE